MDTKILDDRVDEARRAYMAAHDARRAAEVAEREAFAKWGIPKYSKLRTSKAKAKARRS
jgi:hypothetical protein